MIRERRKRLRRFALFCTALCLLMGLGLAETQISMTADDWTWEEDGVSAFHGSILADRDVTDAELSLEISTRLEDSGEIQFISVGGKQLKIRKRGPSTNADLIAGEALNFEGEWILPSDTDTGLAYAEIRLKVTDAEGKSLGEGTLEVGSQAEENSLEEASPVKRAERLTMWLAIGCACVWALAIFRHLMLNRKKN